MPECSSCEKLAATMQNYNFIDGKKYWCLFHTLSNKFNDTLFLGMLKEIKTIFNIIIRIVPCTACRIKAIKYIEDNDFKNISTKQELITFFYNFHNSVNLERNVDLFDINILNSTYDAMNTQTTINDFLDIIDIQYKDDLQTWLNNSIIIFYR
jgi:hypothetical protein